MNKYAPMYPMAAFVVFSSLFYMGILYTSVSRRFVIGQGHQKQERGSVALQSSIFSPDYIPDQYKSTKVSGTIHFCLIAANAEISGEINIFVRSVLLHARRGNVFFHFVVFKGSEKTIPPIFDDITDTYVNVSYELIRVNLTHYLNTKLHNNVRIKHRWSGIYGIGKIFMYDLLEHVNKCIVIDTDTLFGTDPAFLWSEALLKLQPPVAVATTWYPGDSFFNSGVMLHDFEYMRKIKFGNFMNMDDCKLVKEKGQPGFICHHDQQLLNRIKSDHPEMFDNITISWNLGLCFHFRKFSFNSFENEASGLFFGVAHLTCAPPNIDNVFIGARLFLKRNLRDYIRFLEALDFRKSSSYNTVQREPDINKNTTIISE